MKVILLQDVKKQGKKDEVIEVSSGYATNFLFKQNLAVPADTANMNKLKANQRIEDARRKEELEEAKKASELVKTKEYKLNVKVGGNGKIFGSVTSSEISDVIEKETGLKVDKRKIVLKDSIKSLGIYTVTLKLHPEVQTEIKVEINALN